MENEQSFVINGPEGELDCLLYQDEAGDNDFLAVICHPHSLHGGTMDNKVVYIATRGMQECGFDSLRFNFRGVGRSQGSFAEGIGEQDDLVSVIRWAADEGYTRLLLCGFSFGSYVSAAVASQWQNNALWSDQTGELELHALVSIAPPVNHFPFDAISNISIPWLVIHGEEDEVVPFDEVRSWIDSFAGPAAGGQAPVFVTMAGSSHFFHGQLTGLKQHIAGFLKDTGSLPG